MFETACSFLKFSRSVGDFGCSRTCHKFCEYILNVKLEDVMSLMSRQAVEEDGNES